MNTRKMKILIILVAIVALVIISKMIWVSVMTRRIETFESERTDILRRRNYLLDKIVVPPQELIESMPSAVGVHFQGEWAIYSTSMLSAALVNTAILYPETREEAVGKIDSLIRITMSPELRRYDASQWGIIILEKKKNKGDII